MERKEIILKELDHIQAILGRFDAFFFVMKQVCLGAMAAMLGLSVTNHLRIILCFTFMIPPIFFVVESSFRFFHWVRYVGRIEDIKLELNGDLCLCKLYEIVIPKPKIYDQASWCKAIKRFDILYYILWTVIAYLGAFILAKSNIKWADSP